jgi:hypothetical protein
LLSPVRSFMEFLSTLVGLMMAPDLDMFLLVHSEDSPDATALLERLDGLYRKESTSEIRQTIRKHILKDNHRMSTHFSSCLLPLSPSEILRFSFVFVAMPRTLAVTVA